MQSKAILLLNLGSPNSTSIKDVRSYLKEFLSDPRVLDTPSSPSLRSLILNGCILPTRPKRTAHAYSQIWQREGSPLIIESRKLQQNLQNNFPRMPIELAMRYGKPSIEDALGRLASQKISKLFIMPLYPHYAMSSYETVVARVMELLPNYFSFKISNEIQNPNPTTQKLEFLSVLQPFYSEDFYIDALVKSAEPYLQKPFDHLLFSYHGIPERHLRVSDPSKAHCLCHSNCCQIKSPTQSTCYKHQCLETTRLFVEKANIPSHKFSISFQSRLGREPWLKPYTDHRLQEFPKQGIKKILVICPSFVADCLETLEEIAISGKQSFLDAGGSEFTHIPCLNNHPAWIHFLTQKIQSWL